MLGALYGDIAGSQFEFQNFSSKEFIMFTSSCSYTDDSLMTLAIASALVATRNNRDMLETVTIKTMHEVAHNHPNVGWGAKFHDWLFNQKYPKPINSYGNGAGMRVSPVGWVCDSLEETIELSKRVTAISHNHPEGIKGAEAIAAAIYLARTGSSKEDIKKKMIEYYPELETMTIEKLKISGYGIDSSGWWVTCQGSVPQAICSFLESNDFEDAIRNAISLNGDADTLACMAGSIAEAYYGLSYNDEDKVLEYLDEDLKQIYFAFDLIKKKRVKR